MPLQNISLVIVSIHASYFISRMQMLCASFCLSMQVQASLMHASPCVFGLFVCFFPCVYTRLHEYLPCLHLTHLVHLLTSLETGAPGAASSRKLELGILRVPLRRAVAPGNMRLVVMPSTATRQPRQSSFQGAMEAKTWGPTDGEDLKVA